MSDAAVFLIVLACVVAVSCLLRNVIRKVPWLFYVLSVAVVALYFVYFYADVNMGTELKMPLMFLVRRGFLATAMFIFVMYIGVFPRGSAIRRFVQPLRAPLSIMGCILIAAHIFEYVFVIYGPKVISGSMMKANVLVAFWLGVLLFILAIVLGVTSFRFVKKHMKASVWKKVQWFAYVFYVVMFVHMSVMLLPSILKSGSFSSKTIIVGAYVILFVAYFIARIARFQVEKKNGLAAADLSLDQASLEDEEAKL